ncbi:MAG: phage portal protein [Pseudomonadota bacterium]
MFGIERLRLWGSGDVQEPHQRDASDDMWFGGGTRAEIDVHVTVKRARQVPVVRDCLKVLADSVAGLQFGAFRRNDDSTVERLDKHPIARLLANPNRRQTGMEFMSTLVDDLAAHGDFYAEIIYGVGGVIEELWRIDPSKVTVEELGDRSKRFRFTTKGGLQRALLEDEVWHIPMPPVQDALVGTSPILHDGREAVAVAIALQRYANSLFTNDATPTYALSMDGSFKDRASKRNFLNSWARWITGRNRHRPGVLEHGLKPHRMGLTAEEAQFLETRKELWIDLTRLWRVPPHKVGILDRATHSNIEHQGLEFVTDTLRPILELVEQSVGKHLMDDEDEYFEFNVASLLRGDLKARYEAYAIGRQWGWLSVNDVLQAEKRNGIGPAGDRYIEPLNMVPVGSSDRQREPESRASIEKSVAFLRESVSRPGRRPRPRLELVRDAA